MGFRQIISKRLPIFKKITLKIFISRWARAPLCPLPLYILKRVRHILLSLYIQQLFVYIFIMDKEYKGKGMSNCFRGTNEKCVICRRSFTKLERQLLRKIFVKMSLLKFTPLFFCKIAIFHKISFRRTVNYLHILIGTLSQSDNVCTNLQLKRLTTYILYKTV